MKGFLPLHRRYFKHSFWLEKRSFSRAEAWLDLIQLAAYTDHQKIVKASIVKVERGQILTSIRALAERWMWGKNKVAAFLELLESNEMIEKRSGQSETIITLCNYQTYNDQTGVSSDTEEDVYYTEKRTLNPLSMCDLPRIAGHQRDTNRDTNRDTQPADNEEIPPNRGTPTGTRTGTYKNKGKRKEENKGDPPEIPENLNTSEFRSLWEAWVSYRKESKKPLTPSTVKAQLSKLSKVGPEAAKAAIEASICSGWQGLFPEKFSVTPQPKPTPRL